MVQRTDGRVAQNDSQYENELRIDPGALDVEWLEQPQTFFKYSKKLAYAEKERDRLKEKYEVVRAKADNKIRSQYPEKKPTETAINTMVIQDSDVIEAQKDLIDQEYEVKLLLGAVRAFDQRKAALENLVRLQAQNYFAAPREPRNLTGEYRKHLEEKRTSEKIAAATAGKR